MFEFYSPFTDSKNQFIKIGNLKHNHLKQLDEKGIEEGYQIEYKECWNSSVKKKIPKIITSFANSTGGWIFIGIKEKNGVIIGIDKERTDFNQQISQLLTSVSPMPIFETKFLKLENSDKGILVIYVYEGNNSPYIAQGTIYIRNGSSSEPVRSNRLDIDNLSEKSMMFQKKLDEFCKREVYFAGDGVESSRNVICNIYFYNTDYASNRFFLKDILKWADEFTEMPVNNYSSRIFSANSIIFKNSKILGENDITPQMELMFNMSAKLHLPFPCLNDFDKESAVAKINQVTNQTKINEFLFLDGYLCCKITNAFAQQYFEFVKMKKIDISKIMIRIEIENPQNSILYFDNSEFLEYLKRFDVPYCCKNHIETNVAIHPSKKKGSHEFIELLFPLLQIFGINIKNGTKMYVDSYRADYEANPPLPIKATNI